MGELGDALRSTSGSREADELHVRRERTRLLAAFDASLVRTPSSGRTKKWLGAVAAVAAVALVALVALRLASTRAVTPTALAFEAVSVRAERTTKWSRRTEAQVETITLETGSLSIRVDHRSPHRRLLVLLPDGELEDIGTTFSVTADGGRTTAVTVHEGSVVLRLRDALPLTLRAGDSWAPTPRPVVALAPSQPPAVVARAVPRASAVRARSSAEPPDPAAEFRAAMSAFTIGDNARASTLFTQFLGQHPRDSRAEDAAYLRVLALQRAGDSRSMKGAAADYLARYPHGFRFAEVEPLAR
jgi:hypothetical protein